MLGDRRRAWCSEFRRGERSDATGFEPVTLGSEGWRPFGATTNRHKRLAIDQNVGCPQWCRRVGINLHESASSAPRRTRVLFSHSSADQSWSFCQNADLRLGCREMTGQNQNGLRDDITTHQHLNGAVLRFSAGVQNRNANFVAGDDLNLARLPTQSAVLRWSHWYVIKSLGHFLQKGRHDCKQLRKFLSH
jgi:hypothetical protein